jgi:hypothetical protein
MTVRDEAQPALCANCGRPRFLHHPALADAGMYPGQHICAQFTEPSDEGEELPELREKLDACHENLAVVAGRLADRVADLEHQLVAKESACSRLVKRLEKQLAKTEDELGDRDAEIARLREALAPFAELGKRVRVGSACRDSEWKRLLEAYVAATAALETNS